MKFKYNALNKRKKEKEGLIEAPSKQGARMLLKNRGLAVRKLVEYSQEIGNDKETPVFKNINFIVRDKEGKIQFVIGSQPPTSKDIIVFTKQLATMIGSGVPLIQSINILQKQQSSRDFRKALRDIQNEVENGSALSLALSKYPKIFEQLYVSMVEAGESSGNLDTILKKLVTYIEKADKIKSQVKSALYYPVIVLIVAVIVVTALLVFVVPTFAEQFSESGHKLPALTQFVINSSNYFGNNIWAILGGSILFFSGFRYIINTKKGRIVFDRYILKAPIVGDLLKKISIGRFCSTMASMLNSGVNLLAALKITASSSGNKTIELFVENVKFSLEAGKSFSEPLSEGDLFPDMVVSMVEVGESTGALDDMLSKVSEFYEEEVDLAVKTLLSMIEPIMIVLIGGIIAFILVAMYLPIFDMAGTV